MIYHVFANRSNVGDWLSARAIQNLLSSPVVELLCDEPFVPETLDRLSAAAANDLVVIGGGGLFMDYFAPFWTGFESISERVPFCIWGVGCCDIKRASSKPDAVLLERIISRSRLCIVRDELTRGVLSGCNLPGAVACPSFTIVSERPPGHGVLHVDALDNVGDDTYEMMNAVARRFSADTGRPFSAINNEIPAGKEPALTSVLEKYSSADLILTGRLHGCIIGLAMGRKVLAVSGDRKIESFMRAAGLEEWVLGLESADRVDAGLRALAGQTSPVEFVQAARRANEAVARTVLDIVQNNSSHLAAREVARARGIIAK